MGRMGPAGVEELHLPGGATSLGDIIKDELFPAPWSDPSPERARSRVRDLGSREGRGCWGNGTPNLGGDGAHRCLEGISLGSDGGERRGQARGVV